MPAVNPVLVSSVSPCPSVTVNVPNLVRYNFIYNSSFGNDPFGSPMGIGGWSGSFDYANSSIYSSSLMGNGDATFAFYANFAGNQNLAYGPVTGINSGQTYTFAIDFVAQNSATISSFRVAIAWLNASNAGISTSYGAYASGGGGRLFVTATAPAGAVKATPLVMFSNVYPFQTVGLFGGALFEQATSPDPYYAYTPIGFYGYNVDSLTVWRTCDGVTEAVRNASAISVSNTSSYLVTDYEVPVGLVATYQVETFYQGVSQGLTDAQTITVSDSRLWITDPLNPRNAIAISLGGYTTATLGRQTFTSIHRQVKQNKSIVIGKSRPVVQFYGQKGIEGASFEVFTRDAGDAKMEAIVATAPVLIRPSGDTMPNLPSRLYGTLDAIQEPLTWAFESSGRLTRWTVNFDETEPQSISVVFSVYSYAYWLGKYPTTYAAVQATSYGSNTYVYAIGNPPA